jgi:hypothetical protein
MNPPLNFQPLLEKHLLLLSRRLNLARRTTPAAPLPNHLRNVFQPDWDAERRRNAPGGRCLFYSAQAFATRGYNFVTARLHFAR